jgi:hypothetical protein
MARAEILSSILATALLDSVIQQRKAEGNGCRSAYLSTIDEARASLLRGEGLTITDQTPTLEENVGETILELCSKITGQRQIIDELFNLLETVAEKSDRDVKGILLHQIPRLRQLVNSMK